MVKEMTMKELVQKARNQDPIKTDIVIEQWENTDMTNKELVSALKRIAQID